jgi:predicted DNA-binding transcriptional regulator AlpA
VSDKQVPMPQAMKRLGFKRGVIKQLHAAGWFPNSEPTPTGRPRFAESDLDAFLALRGDPIAPQPSARPKTAAA